MWITAPPAQPLPVHQTPTVSAAAEARPPGQMQTARRRAHGGRGRSSLDLGLFIKKHSSLAVWHPQPGPRKSSSRGLGTLELGGRWKLGQEGAAVPGGPRLEPEATLLPGDLAEPQFSALWDGAKH